MEHDFMCRLRVLSGTRGLDIYANALSRTVTRSWFNASVQNRC